MIGQRIISIRETQNISQEELAKRTGLNTLQLESIENDKILPSLAPLIKIARVLGVRLGTFLDDDEHIGPIINKKDQHQEGISFSNNETTSHTAMEYLSLASNKGGRNMEPFIIDVKPSDEKNSFSNHEGEEFIYVLHGEIEINYGTDTYHLSEGESIYYDSIVGHHVHAKGNEKAKILAVIYVPA